MASSEHPHDAHPLGSVHNQQSRDAQSIYTARTGKTLRNQAGKEISMTELLRRLNKVQSLSTKLGNHQIPTEILRKLGTKPDRKSVV